MPKQSRIIGISIRTHNDSHFVDINRKWDDGRNTCYGTYTGKVSMDSIRRLHRAQLQFVPDAGYRFRPQPGKARGVEIPQPYALK